MKSEELIPRILMRLGPVQVTTTVIYSLLVSLVLIVFALALRAGMQRGLSSWQMAAETIVEHLEGVMREMFGCNPRPYTPLVVTLALFIGVSNLMDLIPGLRAPTSDISTTAALAIIVFFTVHGVGIYKQGLGGYLRHYLEPVPFLAPLEILSELTRVLTLTVRLFGNVFSGELVIAILVMLTGLIVPVPIMILEVLTSVVQAYIFAVLTTVYLSASVRTQQKHKA